MFERCRLALNLDLRSNPNAADESPRDALAHFAIAVDEVLADDFSELLNSSWRDPSWSAIQLLAQRLCGAVKAVYFPLSLFDPLNDVGIAS